LTDTETEALAQANGPAANAAPAPAPSIEPAMAATTERRKRAFNPSSFAMSLCAFEARSGAL
jgi:hypothetical protein